MPRPTFFHHLHPPTIPEKQAGFSYTLGSGGAAVFLVLILVVSGILEMFYYLPSPEQAANSIQIITYHIPAGNFIRNLHYWSGQLLVVVSGIHLLRVIFTGAYLPPRRLNYLIGLGLFVLIIFLDFTGYILRWDGGIQWALVTGTNLVKTIPLIGDSLYLMLVGGPQPGTATLIRFYTWHIFGLTFFSGILLVWHIFRVRRDGGIAAPPSEYRLHRERISRYELVNREVLGMLYSGSVLTILAAFFSAPISPPISMSSAAPDMTRAPWFFLWIQELLRYGDPFWLGVFLPAVLLTILVIIPYFFPLPAPEELGRWFPRRSRLAQIAAALLVLMILFLSLRAL